MDDFMMLLDAAHKQGLKVILDIQLSNTSIEHPWFRQSRAGKDNDKSDFYIWQDKVPNNWRSFFGGSAWTFDSKRGQYYLHSFLPEAPDLNWRNQDMVDAVLADLAYWLELGVDGFRLSAINLIVKDRTFRNNPLYPGHYTRYNKQRHIFDRNRPFAHRRIRAIRDLANSYDDKVLIGEIIVEPPGEPEVVASYYGTFNDELNLAFDYSLINLPFKSNVWKTAAQRWYDAVGRNWPAWVLSNHDHIRMATKFKGNVDKIRLAAMFLFTQRGTMFLYYGQELGLENSHVGTKESHDVLAGRFLFRYKSRDGERGPMIWKAIERFGGFSEHQPWLPLVAHRERFAADSQAQAEVSTYHYYQKFIRLRKKHPALIDGSCSFLQSPDKNVLAYLRSAENETLLMVLNFSTRTKDVQLNMLGIPFSAGDMVFSTNKQAKPPVREGNTLHMHGLEGAIYSMLL
jgi:alpha-glucosidase